MKYILLFAEIVLVPFLGISIVQAGNAEVPLVAPDGRVLMRASFSTNEPLHQIRKSIEAEGGSIISLNPEHTLTIAIPSASSNALSVRTGLVLKVLPDRSTKLTGAKSGSAGEPGLGARPPTPEEDKYIRQHSQQITKIVPEALSTMRAELEGAESIPTSIDNSTSKYFPPIGSQGGQNSCAAWASCYYYNTFTQARDADLDVSGGNTDFVNSPAFMYPLVNGGTDNGANTAYLVCRLNDIGCCNLTLKPYSESDFTSWPSEQAWINALQRRTLSSHPAIGSYKNGCSDADLAAMKQHLANGNLLVTETDVYSNWRGTFRDNQGRGIQNGVLFSHAGETPEGHHALVIVGYNDNRPYVVGTTTNHGAFLICNSWDSTWGTFNSSGAGSKGFMWVAYDYFKANNGCFGVAYYNEDRANYRPRLYAVAGINHAQRGRVTFSGGVGSAQSPAWSSYCPIDWAGGNTLAITDVKRVAVDLTDGMNFISDYSNIKLFSRLSVSPYASTSGTVTTATFFYDFGGSGSYSVVTSPDTVVTVNPGNAGFATATFSSTGNRAPVLSNPRVSPLSGTSATVFEFLVDYYDPDGDPPQADYRRMCLTGSLWETMTLKSGTPANGTYSCTTTLAPGSYSYCYLFADTAGKTSVTDWQNGPTVYSDGEATINVFVQCARISTDLRLKYSLTSATGPWTDLPVTKQRLDPVLASPGAQVWFEASVASPNYTYREWEAFENGVRFAGDTHPAWSIVLGTATTSVGLNVYWDYAPLTYTISGTVKHGDGSLVPGGVDLALSSSEQTATTHSSDGNFSFSGVYGGVSVSLTASASGHQFCPPRLVFENLQGDKPGQTITAYIADDTAPTVSFNATPPAIDVSSAVTFAWSGQDDVTSSGNLVFQYKLDGLDGAWSTWASNTSCGYDLPNGVYTFWVRARDEAGNTNQAPIKNRFIVNAAPQVLSAVRNTRSVWSSRVSIFRPASASHPTNCFVLLPEHSGIADMGLVPVRLHRADEVAPCGAHQMIAGQTGLPALISSADGNWLVKLPDALSPGQTGVYDIVWGKVSYFGWNEFQSVPLNFANGASDGCYAFLDDQLRLWRMASKRKVRNTTLNIFDSWMFREISSVSGCERAEEIVKFIPANVTVFDDAGTQRYYGTLGLFANMEQGFLIADSQVWSFWPEEYWTRTLAQVDSQTHAYGCNRFDANNLAPVDNGTQSAQLTNDNWSMPTLGPDGRVWIVATKSGATVGEAVWLEASIVNRDGSIVTQSMDIAYVPAGTKSRGITSGKPCIGGGKLWFVYRKYWRLDRSDGWDRRSAVYCKGFNLDGSVFASEFLVSPPPAADGDDVWENCSLQTTGIVADRTGKVWLSFSKHTDTPTISEDNYYYSIVNPNGSLWKGPVETVSQRRFEYCDRDGYIWATENAFKVLDATDTQVMPDRAGFVAPNQRAAGIDAAVQTTGYRLFDRWSPQAVSMDIPSRCVPSVMELFDLDVWSNALHSANLTVKNGTNTIWNKTGVLTGSVSIAVSEKLCEGPNVLTLTQDDFLGGQVLLTFPYVINHVISAAGDSHVVVSPAGDVVVSNGAAQVFSFTPDRYYHVASVEVDGISVGTNVTYTLSNVTCDHSLRAYSAPYCRLQLNVSTTFGTAIPSGTTTNDYGAFITASVGGSPAVNGATQYICTGWAGTGSASNGQGTNTSFVITNASSLTWLWKTNYWLAPLAVGGGAVNVTSNWYARGTNVAITATASNGWHFQTWGGNTNGCVVAGNVITAAMTQARSITASFAINAYDITAVAGPNGSIAPSGTVWLLYGGSTNFSMTANPHCYVTNVVVDGVGRGPTNSYAFTNVTTGGHTITALFGIERYSLAVASLYGTPTPAGTTTNDWNTLLTAAVGSPVANGTTQYVCTGWTGTGSVPGSGTGANTGPFALTNNSSIAWLWKTNYWLATATNGSGSVNVPGSWQAAGSNLTVTATPGAHWHFTAWSGATNGCTISSNVITAPMTSARAITANFAIDQHSLVVTTPYGKASPAAGTNWINWGSTVTAAVTNSPVGNGTTQYVCTGWTGMGSVPASGGGTNTGPFTLTNDCSIAWLWATNYWLDTATNGSGNVDATDQWCRVGSNVGITATPTAFNRFTGWSGQTNGCTIASNQITVLMDRPRTVTANFVRQYSLSVATPYGQGTPPTGTNWYDTGTSVTAILTNSPVGNGGTQYVCQGWTGMGSVPANGTTTNTGAFTLTSDSAVTWLWRTEYWLDTETNGNGSVDVGPGWFAGGSVVPITATAHGDQAFVQWTGSGVPKGALRNNPLLVTMDRARAVVANFMNEPLVWITSPTEGKVYPPPARLTVTADAYDVDGIQKVEFYQGITKIGEKSASPYRCVWTNVPTGNYVLTAWAWDTLNNVSTSMPVNVTVDPNAVKPGLPWLQLLLGQ